MAEDGADRAGALTVSGASPIKVQFAISGEEKSPQHQTGLSAQIDRIVSYASEVIGRPRG